MRPKCIICPVYSISSIIIDRQYFEAKQVLGFGRKERLHVLIGAVPPTLNPALQHRHQGPLNLDKRSSPSAINGSQTRT
jgi:hypothetical protein